MEAAILIYALLGAFFAGMTFRNVILYLPDEASEYPKLFLMVALTFVAWPAVILINLALLEH